MVITECDSVAVVDCIHSCIHRGRVAGDDDAVVNRSIQTELGSMRTCRRRRRRRDLTDRLVWVGTEVSRSAILGVRVLLLAAVRML